MLDRLKPRHGSRKPRTRRGRGIAAGKGRTCGRGQKGAGARSGFKRRTWFEGGQMPLARRLPKRGFTNIFREAPQVVNLRDLTRFDKGAVIDAELLAEAGLITRSRGPVKVLGEGELADALTLRVSAISAGARKKIEAAGGSVEIEPARKPKPLTRGGKKTEGSDQA